jgi:HD-GYP domain-containing protein (c-di-GMP phosphodiesterase class II)
VGAAHDQTLSVLSSALELRERYTAGHSQRVRSYTLLLAERMGVRDAETLAQFSAGALFHDVGKIGVPDAVLLKEGPLDASEWEVVRSHPKLGADLVGRVEALSAARELVLSHHERFDGTGYPRRLQGGNIPLGARLFAVADAFDAMTTKRPYRPESTFEKARTAITEGAGSQFDPRVVDAFLSIPFEIWAASAASSGVNLRRTDAPAVPAPAPS